MQKDKLVTHGVDADGKEWHTSTSILMKECSFCGSKRDLCLIDCKIICSRCYLRRRDQSAKEVKPE